jgi:hypothetical protein
MEMIKHGSGQTQLYTPGEKVAAEHVPSPGEKVATEHVPFLHVLRLLRISVKINR